MNQLQKENIQVLQYEASEIADNVKKRAILSNDELKRAESFVYDEDRDWFIACRVTLREALAKTIGCSAAEVKFQYNENGKPFLTKDNKSLVQFNMSHTKEKLLIAIHPFKPVGVDIEKQQVKDHDNIMKRFFHPDEVEVFLTLSPAEKQNAFYQLWVIKEALAKAQGLGLFQIISKINVEGFVMGDNIVAHGLTNAKLELLPVDSGFCAAICVLEV